MAPRSEGRRRAAIASRDDRTLFAVLATARAHVDAAKPRTRLPSRGRVARASRARPRQPAAPGPPRRRAAPPAAAARRGGGPVRPLTLRRDGRARPLIERIRRSVIGDDAVLDGPFGPRRLVYADAHGLRPLAVVHRGLHPRPRPAAVREHAHRGVGDRPAHHGAARGRPPDHPPGRQRRRGGRRHLLRVGRDRRDRQARPAARPRPAGRRAARRLPRSLRAPLERAAVARVARRRRHDPRGRATGGSTSRISRPSSRATGTGR